MAAYLYSNLKFPPILLCLLKSFCMIWDKVRHYICNLTTYVALYIHSLTKVTFANLM